MLLELDENNNVVRKYTWGLDLAGQNGEQNRDREGAAGLESAAGTLDPIASRQRQVGGLLALHQPEDDPTPDKNYVFFYDATLDTPSARQGQASNVGQLIDWENSGNVVAKYEYDPYGGNLLDPTDPQESGPYGDDNPIRFSTKYFDDETALGYWGYRYYSPRLGRWISRDPLEEAGGYNLHAYVRNAPVNHVDPTGAWTKELHEQATREAADAVGMNNKDCVDILVRWNIGVDTWTGSALCPQFHFDLDSFGNRFHCGRGCWAERRTNEAYDILSKGGGCRAVKRALRKMGEALHSLQDGFSHTVSHRAQTPVDHAPQLCLIPPFIFSPRCWDPEKNPNWDDPHRPDKLKGPGWNWTSDWQRAKAQTKARLQALMASRCVRCCCAKKGAR